jgi:uncharacterized protein (TIGR02996 family)
MSLHTHPEWQDLLAGICAYPDDDLRRLVAADWLTEHGEEERAEFIRTGCELATLGASVMCSRPGSRMGDGCDNSGCPRCGPERRLWIQSINLFRVNWQAWFPDAIATDHAELGYGMAGHDPSEGVLIRRGFVSEVRAPLAWLIGGECQECGHEESRIDPSTCPYCSGTGRTPAHLDELVRTYPITRVVVTDREPRPNTAEEGAVEWWGWYVVGELMEQEEYDLPTELWPQLRHHRTSLAWDRDRPSRWCQFPTREAALDALSDALLNPARERAGLPALHPAATSAASAASAELL